jgi:hypothetical protein
VPKIGKWTITGTVSREGRTYAMCRCECGRERAVAMASLRSGRSRSCGKGACKDYARADTVARYVPPKPRVVKPWAIAKAWKRYHHPDPRQRRTIAQLADVHGVNVNTLTAIFGHIRRCGGLPQYLKAIGA